MNTSSPRWHVCLTEELSCSGLSPCPACHAFVQEQILPVGEVAAGLNGGILAFIHDLLSALAARGIQPAQLGLEVPAMFVSAEAQSAAFAAGCTEGWRRFHVALARPEVRAELGVKLTDVSRRDGVTGLRDEGMTAEESRTRAPSHDLHPFDEDTLPQAPPEALPKPAKPMDPVKLAEDRGRAKEIARPMDAEEIAAAGVSMPMPAVHAPVSIDYLGPEPQDAVKNGAA